MTKIVPNTGEISVSNLNQIKNFKAPWSENRNNTSVSDLLQWFENNSLDQGNTLANRSTDAFSTARGSSVMKILVKIKSESKTEYNNSADGRIHITCAGGDESRYKIEIDTLVGNDNINHETTGAAGQTAFDFSSSLGLGGTTSGTAGNYYKIKIESPPNGGSSRRMSLCVRPGISGRATATQGGMCDYWLDVDTDNMWMSTAQNKPLAQGGATIFMGRFEWAGKVSSSTVWSNQVQLWSEPHTDGGGTYKQGVGSIVQGYTNK